MWEALAKALPELSAVALVIITQGALLGYLFWKYIPSLAKSFEKSLKEAHETNRKQSDDFRAALDKQQAAFLEALAKERHAYSHALQVAIASNTAIEKAVDRLTNAVLNRGNA